MNVLRPLMLIVGAVLRVVANSAVLQVAGLALLTVAAATTWGAVGGFAAAGGSLVLIGVALEQRGS